MKPSVFLIPVLFLSIMSVPAENISHAPKDNGRMCATWLPSQLIPVIGKQPTGLIAKYEPPLGASYYVIVSSAGKNTRTSTITYFFETKNNQATLLGKDVHKFPFSEYIPDSQIVCFLWQDYLARWIEQDGKDGIQEKLNARAKTHMTEEEAFYLTKAGFKIPSTTKLVPNFLPEKPRPKR